VKLRERARQHLDNGAVTPSYPSDLGKTIEILVCVLRYTVHQVTATRLARHGQTKHHLGMQPPTHIQHYRGGIG
jgi:bacterioferritin